MKFIFFQKIIFNPAEFFCPFFFGLNFMRESIEFLSDLSTQRMVLIIFNFLEKCRKAVGYFFGDRIIYKFWNEEIAFLFYAVFHDFLMLKDVILNLF